MPTLPVDVDGKLEPFDGAALTLMDIRRRGVKNDDHCTYDFGPDGAGCTRKFSCAWDERFNAMILFVGAAKTYVDGGGDTKISRLVPQVDPEFDNWICTKCQVVGYRYMGAIDDVVAGSEPLPIFDRADLECTYELVPFTADVLDDELDPGLGEFERYVTRPGLPTADVNTKTDYIGLPGGVLNFATSTGAGRPAGTPIPFAVGFPECKSDLSYIWHRLPYTLWGAGTDLTNRIIGTYTSRGYMGALNKTEFDGHPPLSLQLVGVEQRAVPDPTGMGYSWSIRYLLSDKPVPYGHLGLYFHDTAAAGSASGYYMVLRPAAGQTDIAPASIGDDDSLFHVREFVNLFVPGDEL